MLEIVAERGYGAVTVRELAQIAGVSSRAFYQNYSGKEECFLRTHELVVRRIVGRVGNARAGQGDERQSLQATVHAFLDELQREPRAARLLLIDAYVAGPIALEQVRRAEQRLEARVVKCFASAFDGAAIPAKLGRGVTVGLICVARSRLLVDRDVALARLTGELADWIAEVRRAFEDNIATAKRLRSPEPQFTDFVEDGSLLNIDACRKQEVDGDHGIHGDRTLIVAAVARLAASESYDELTVSKIRRSAGASSNKFTAHFTGVRDCFQEAVELHTRGVVSRLDSARHLGGPSNSHADEVIASLCTCVARDPAFARLCFVDIFRSGQAGVQSLNRFIGHLADLIEGGKPEQGSGSSTAIEAGAAAIWAAIRDEITLKRRLRAPEMVPLLKAFVPASSAESTEIENSAAKNLTDPAPTAMLVPRAERMSSALTVTTK